MVGLPYPNLHSPELKEKMSYLSRTVPADGDGKQGGQVRLENHEIFVLLNCTLDVIVG